MQKYALSIALVLIIIVSFLVGYLFLQNEPEHPVSDGSSPSVTLPIATTVDTGAKETTLSLRTTGGEVITVRNFLEHDDVVTDPSNTGYVYLGNHPPFSETSLGEVPSYTIGYTASTQYFNVVLNREPVGQSRREAEQYLVRALGVDGEQLCELNYMVSVPAYVNEHLSGQNLLFSECSSAVDLY
jgi:hypothetical protein